MKKAIYLLVFLVFAACSTREAGESSTSPVEEEDMPSPEGQWVNISMKVTINADVDSVVDIPPGKWEEILQIKPILTTLKDDSTFISEYRNLGDSLFMTSTGVWWLDKDSLYMEEHGVLNAYHLKIRNDTASFTGYIDWDQDGEADDLYYGEQVRPGL